MRLGGSTPILSAVALRPGEIQSPCTCPSPGTVRGLLRWVAATISVMSDEITPAWLSPVLYPDLAPGQGSGVASSQNGRPAVVRMSTAPDRLLTVEVS